MATFRIESIIDRPAPAAWARLGDLGNSHLAFPGVLTACAFDGNVRTVTFADGTVIRERIVTVDAAAMRLAYGVLDRFEHHASIMEIIPVNPGQCRFQWVSDVLPDAAIERVAGLMTKGAAAFKSACEA
ncbi:SRPBCC family protein [Asticcacaulis solisilvae]|uniref:SRPBCC family protein n=1 Tax=Asticcacaulis solisilvae TaxID=1217274 RepID=UPI003FD876D8